MTTLTFEPETNESIIIQLFICLFTVEMEEMLLFGREGGIKTLLGGKKKGGECGKTSLV